MFFHLYEVAEEISLEDEIEIDNTIYIVKDIHLFTPLNQMDKGKFETPKVKSKTFNYYILVFKK